MIGRRRSKSANVQPRRNTVPRQSRCESYCLIQECSRADRALPHQDAPVGASHCQSGRAPNPLSCSFGGLAFPSRPDAARAAARSGEEERSGATRSHAQRDLSREHGEAGEHRTFREASTAAHCAPVGGPRRRRSTYKRYVTEPGPSESWSGVRRDRCRHWHFSGGRYAKHHLMCHLAPPVFQAALQCP
jgi:hypothetical protein